MLSFAYNQELKTGKVSGHPIAVFQQASLGGNLGMDYEDHGRIGEIVLFSWGKFMGPKPHEYAVDGSAYNSAVGGAG